MRRQACPLVPLLLALLAGCGGANQPGRPPDSLKVVEPPGGGEGHALVVFLHGRGQSVDSVSDGGFEDAYEAMGEDAPVFAFPDGGESSYWHDRDDRAWGTYVLEEVIPAALEESGADPGRVAIGGISMGGFGALALAAESGRRWCAVGAHSPAIFLDAGSTAPGAFDDAEDFAEHDVISRADRFPDVPLHLDVGEEDRFRPGVEAFAEAAGVRARYFTGGHESVYWDDHWPDYLRFYSEACQKPG